MPTGYDDNYAKYNTKRISDRVVDELVGMSRGILADGVVNQAEAEFLHAWMQDNARYIHDPLINRLYARLHEMLIDGILDKNEQTELFAILESFSGGMIDGHISAPTPTTLPVDHNAAIEIPTKKFCLTGQFAYGPRKVCEEIITDCGGIIRTTVTVDLDYLVIGAISTRSWIHSNYGRKVEAAIMAKKYRGRPTIVTEDMWADAVFST